MVLKTSRITIGYGKAPERRCGKMASLIYTRRAAEFQG
jgi:hypothetical protein